jgi:hypothetical protein
LSSKLTKRFTNGENSEIMYLMWEVVIVIQTAERDQGGMGRGMEGIEG